MIKVFIDGAEGTTGLRLFDRMKERDDVTLLEIPKELRKDVKSRAALINESDVTFLCLPDEAAIEAVSLVKSDTVKIIDASTAHRTNDGWAYGFPELSKERLNAVKTGKRVAVPGCHASGFLALVSPLVTAGLIKKDYPFSCFSLTGYSGGGKKMIAQYEESKRATSLSAPRQYAIGQAHKHLKEMTAISGIASAPVFSPIVADFYSGMEVSVPLNGVSCCIAEVHFELEEHYANSKLVEVLPLGAESFGGFLPANYMSGNDGMKIIVSGGEGRILLSALYDNLGKGASGAAVQCMNLMFNLEETKGLNL